ncbi:MAG: PAS domain S-box protein, partial [Thiohalomonadaceae bacterium]
KGEVIGVFAAARDISERLRAEAALREANAYNRRLIEASLDPLVTIGPNGTITDVNAATEKATGCSREELIGTDFSDYFTEPERARAGYRQAFEQGFVVDYPLEIRRSDGHVTPVLYNAAVYRDERGEVQGVFAAARDISARKRAEEEAQRLGRRNELLLQSAGEGIYGLDRQGRCTFMNPAGAAMLGYAPEELVGRSLHEVIHHSRADGTPYPVEECRVHTAYTEATVFRGTDEVFWRRDGRAFPVEYVSTPIIEDGRLTGAVVAFLDITERKEAEEALRRLNRELDERVKARTAELEEANKELESFSYSVSHDLRTPLRAIDGFSKILLVEHRDKLDEDGKRLLGIVRENTEKMGQLISDILAFSRTSRAALTKMPVDMRVLIAEVWDELRVLEPERAYDFHLGALPPAEGDRALLRQVFSNLLANAVKFTRGREVARIEVTGEQTDSEVVYHVRDNGVGFDMRYVDRLFGVFQRLHSATEFEGTGIGLAVVKRIIVRHGGRVWAEGRPGEGATFHVALPRTGDGAQVDAPGEQP